MDALHVTLDTSSVLALDTSSVLPWLHCILHWSRLLYFSGRTSSYVGHVFSTSVGALYLTLDTSSVLRQMHYILRWTCLLHFGGCTSLYVGHVFCTSVGALHLTLDTSSLCKLAWREKKCWRTGETHTHPKNVTFLRVSNIHLLNPTVVKQIFCRSEYNCSTKGHQDDCRHVSSARFWAERNKTDLKKWWKRWAIRLFFVRYPCSSFLVILASLPSVPRLNPPLLLVKHGWPNEDTLFSCHRRNSLESKPSESKPSVCTGKKPMSPWQLRLRDVSGNLPYPCLSSRCLLGFAEGVPPKLD